MTFKVPEKNRLANGPVPSKPEDGNNGAFLIPLRHKLFAYCIASDGLDWEHVSITLVRPVSVGKDHTKFKDIGRSPTWFEMCLIKDWFWSQDEAVIQIHPTLKDYVNLHPYCLHLWRPTNQTLNMPSPLLVGPTKDSMEF
jgi:hypothetical protein